MVTQKKKKPSKHCLTSHQSGFDIGLTYVKQPEMFQDRALNSYLLSKFENLNMCEIKYSVKYQITVSHYEYVLDLPLLWISVR